MRLIFLVVGMARAIGDGLYYLIVDVVVHNEYQGKGIGTKILQSKLKEYSDKNIEIQYFKQNPVGKLYKRLGFEPNGETEFHYQMIKRKN